METVYLGLGTNQGDRRENLLTAVDLLARRAGTVRALSSLYETEPWGFRSANRFLNAAVALETELEPLELLDATRQIEIELGRTAKSTPGHYEDRPIDIDLLLYGDRVMHTPRLTIPHPRLHERRFVLDPLAEIAPDAVHPLFHQTIIQLKQSL